MAAKESSTGTGFQHDGPTMMVGRQSEDCSVGAAGQLARWRDTPYVCIFVALIVGFVIVAIVDLLDYSKTKCFRSSFGNPLVVFVYPGILGIISACVLIAAVITVLYYFAAAMYTQRFILYSMILQLIVSLGASVFYLVQAQWMSGTFSLVWLAVSAIMYWCLRGLIPRATVRLDVAMRVAERNPTILFISLLGALFSVGWAVLLAAVGLASYGKTLAEECSMKHKRRPDGEFMALLAYLAITNFLMTELVRAVVRFAICHTYGWWCTRRAEDFSTRDGESGGDRGSGVRASISDEFESLPQTTWQGLAAALSYSLGTLCLSSLWLSVIKFLAQVLLAWSQTLIFSVMVRPSPDIAVVLLAWVLSNCMMYLDSMLSHFTNYILVYAAVANASYYEAFFRSANLVLGEGLTAVLTECMAGGTLTFSSWCVGTISSLCAFVYMRFIHPYPAAGVFFVCSYVQLVSIQVSGLLLAGVSSGVQTMFVVISEDAARLDETRPQVSAALRATEEDY